MKKIETGFEGLWVLEPKVFSDSRGFFLETMNQKVFQDLGLPLNFVQDNYSQSSQGTLRGLHFQQPNAQGKLVRCLRGSVVDVVVDLRSSQPTYGKYFIQELSEQNKLAMFVPEGFAHGFYVTSPIADFQYKCTDFYSPANEKGLLWNDAELNIPWPLSSEPILSPKDKNLMTWSQLKLLNPFR